MTTTTWDHWFADIRLQADGVANPVMKHALVRTARDFLRRTRAWMVWLDPIVSATGAQATEYDFDLPTGAELVRLERATVNGKPLTVQSFRDITHDWTQNDQTPQGIVSPDCQTFRLVGQFPQGQTVQVEVSLVPSLDSIGIPDSLATKHHDLIAAGALSRILGMRAQPFYDPNESAVRGAEYQGLLGSYNVDIYRGHTNLVPRSKVKWC